jgi:hypothetical protein
LVHYPQHLRIFKVKVFDVHVLFTRIAHLRYTKTRKQKDDNNSNKGNGYRRSICCDEQLGEYNPEERKVYLYKNRIRNVTQIICYNYTIL